MDWLNYHHLLYFWTVAREGGVSKAAMKLRLSQPTISAQVKMLEGALGERLLERQGSHARTPNVGRVVEPAVRPPCGSDTTEPPRGRRLKRPAIVAIPSAPRTKVLG